MGAVRDGKEPEGGAAASSSVKASLANGSLPDGRVRTYSADGRRRDTTPRHHAATPRRDTTPSTAAQTPSGKRQTARRNALFRHEFNGRPKGGKLPSFADETGKSSAAAA